MKNILEDELKRFFDRCSERCAIVWKDKLFNCSVLVGGIMNIGYEQDEKNDFFDLKQEVQYDTMSQFIKYYLRYNNEGFYKYCNFCNGFGKDINPYKCIPGEQL